MHYPPARHKYHCKTSINLILNYLKPSTYVYYKAPAINSKHHFHQCQPVNKTRGHVTLVWSIWLCTQSFSGAVRDSNALHWHFPRLALANLGELYFTRREELTGGNSDISAWQQCFCTQMRKLDFLCEHASRSDLLIRARKLPLWTRRSHDAIDTRRSGVCLSSRKQNKRQKHLFRNCALEQELKARWSEKCTHA